MASAHLALRARLQTIKPGQIDTALHNTRALVKTHLMRQTLHLIPSDEFSLYISAMKKRRFEAVFRIMSQFSISRTEVDRMNEDVLETLGSSPMTNAELIQRIRPKVSKNVNNWMDKVWGKFRPALIEGLICYGPEQGQEVTFVRSDKWLPKQKKVSEAESRNILFRRFLAAYGPATIQDFSKWSGLSMPEAKSAKLSAEDDLIEVNVEGKKALLLRDDYEELTSVSLKNPFLRLIPGFDSYLLAHVNKDHLIPPVNYKRIYRNQGWISNSVLLNGRIIAVWSYKRSGTRLVVTIEPLRKLSKAIQNEIRREADSLAAFLDLQPELVFMKS